MTHFQETVLERLPKLKDLRIGRNTSIKSYMPHLPLSQLTDITIQDVIISSMEIQSILQCCSSIVHADLLITDVDTPFDHQTPKIIVPKLKFLDLTLRVTFSWNDIFGSLLLPSLEALSCFGLPSPNFFQAVTTLLIRSKCSLLYLFIDHNAKGEHEPLHLEFTQLFQETPNLRSFTTGYIAPPALVRAMHGGLLPRLIDADWTIKPEGLCTLLDLLDAHSAQPSSNFQGVICATCLRGKGFAAACRCYCKNYMKYKAAGVDIELENNQGDDLRSS